MTVSDGPPSLYPPTLIFEQYSRLRNASIDSVLAIAVVIIVIANYIDSISSSIIEIMASVPGEQISHLLTPSAIAGYVCWQCHVVDEDSFDETRPLKRCKGCRRAVYAVTPAMSFDFLWVEISHQLLVQSITTTLS